MTKLIPFLMLLVPAVATAASTAPPPSIFSPSGLGFYGGVVIGSAEFYPALAMGSKAEGVLGYGGGAYVEFRLFSFLFVQSTMLYENRVFYMHSTDSISAIKNTYKFKYLDFPLLLKIKPDWTWQPYLFIGPSLGALIAATMDLTAETRTTTAGVTIDVKPSLRPSLLSLYFGGGLNIPIAHPVGLFFEGGLSRGVLNISTAGGSTKISADRIFGGLSFSL